eukprot:308380_1
MTQSWYVTSGCVDQKELKPWWIIAIGIVIQMIINTIVLSTKFQNSSDNDNSQVSIILNQSNNQSLDHKNETQTCCKSKCQQLSESCSNIKNSQWFKMFSALWLIWQFLSILLILILDIAKSADKLNQFNSAWYRYQCLAAILLSSSNAKTLFSYIATVGVIVGSTARQYKNVQENTNEFKLLDCMQKLYYQPLIHFGFSKLKTSFILFAAAMGFIVISSLMPYIFSGIFAYMWIEMIVCLIVVCSVGLFFLLLNVDSTNAILQIVVPSSAAFFYILFGLCMVNVFSGIGYWDSFQCVVLERHWNTYMNHMISNITTSFRFVTMIF